jgi:predicted RNA-binding protein YlqC (UPF0109 family)
VSIADDYVDGDVNTIDDNVAQANVEAPTAQAALEYIAKSLADDPSAVSVALSEKSGKVVLSLSLSADDIGRVIGRRGRTAQAIRSLVAAAGSRDGVTTSVDILD